MLIPTPVLLLLIASGFLIGFNAGARFAEFMLRGRERRLSDLRRRIHAAKERILRCHGIDLGPWLIEIPNDPEPDEDTDEGESPEE